MDTVGPDDHASLLRDRCAALGMTTDASHLVAVHEDLLHREAFPQLNASRNGRIGEQLVEYLPPRVVTRSDAVARWRRATEGDGAEIEGQPGNGGTVRGD